MARLVRLQTILRISTLKNIDILRNEILEDVNILRSRGTNNKMRVNVEKNKYANFDFRDFNFVSDFPFYGLDYKKDKCNWTLVKKKHDFKYLGVSCDSKLTWGKSHYNLGFLQTSYTKDKTSRRLFDISKKSNFLQKYSFFVPDNLTCYSIYFNT